MLLPVTHLADQIIHRKAAVVIIVGRRYCKKNSKQKPVSLTSRPRE